jgi:hypothetical protein
MTDETIRQPLYETEQFHVLFAIASALRNQE